jgi:hypothetical protein
VARAVAFPLIATTDRLAELLAGTRYGTASVSRLPKSMQFLISHQIAAQFSSREHWLMQSLTVEFSIVWILVEVSDRALLQKIVKSALSTL